MTLFPRPVSQRAEVFGFPIKIQLQAHETDEAILIRSWQIISVILYIKIVRLHLFDPRPQTCKCAANFSSLEDVPPSVCGHSNGSYFNKNALW